MYDMENATAVCVGAYDSRDWLHALKPGTRTLQPANSAALAHMFYATHSTACSDTHTHTHHACSVETNLPP